MSSAWTRRPRTSRREPGSSRTRCWHLLRPCRKRSRARNSAGSCHEQDWASPATTEGRAGRVPIRSSRQGSASSWKRPTRHIFGQTSRKSRGSEMKPKEPGSCRKAANYARFSQRRVRRPEHANGRQERPPDVALLGIGPYDVGVRPFFKGSVVLLTFHPSIFGPSTLPPFHPSILSSFLLLTLHPFFLHFLQFCLPAILQL